MLLLLLLALLHTLTLAQTDSPTPSLTPTASPTYTSSRSATATRTRTPSTSGTWQSSSRSPRSQPSATATAAVRSGVTVSPAGQIVLYSLAGFFAFWATVLLVTLSGKCLLLCEPVVAIMCWAGAVPATLGRALGVWVGTALLHCTLLPLLNLALFLTGFLLGAAHRTQALLLLTTRACYPAASLRRPLPRHLLPALPPSFPAASPPAHRYVEKPPPPWWSNQGEGTRAYTGCVRGRCLHPLACNDEGEYTYPCLPEAIGKGLVLLSYLGIYLLIYGMGNGMVLLLLIPLAGALAAFLSSFLAIPAGLLSVCVTCFQWEGHLYTVLPRLCERAGVVCGERLIDALAAAIACFAVAPLCCLGLATQRRAAALTPWAQACLRTLSTGAGVPPQPPPAAAPEEGREREGERGAGAGLGGAAPLYYPPQPQYYQPQYYQPPQPQYAQPQYQPQQAAYYPAPTMQQVITLAQTPSGRTLVLSNRIQAFYPPLGIEHFNECPAATIWAPQGAYYPPPLQQQPGYMPAPRMPSWRDTHPPLPRAMSWRAAPGSTPLTQPAQLPGELSGAPREWSAGSSSSTDSSTDASSPDVMFQSPLGSQCQGCGAAAPPGAASSWATACSGGCRVCPGCLGRGLQAQLASPARLAAVRSFEELLACPWSKGCLLVAQGEAAAGLGSSSSSSSREGGVRLQAALRLREAGLGLLQGGELQFAPCMHTTACPGLVAAPSLRLAQGQEAAVQWSKCMCCGKEAPPPPPPPPPPPTPTPTPQAAAAAAAAAPPSYGSMTLWPPLLYAVGELPISLPPALVALVAAPKAAGWVGEEGGGQK